MLKTQLLVLDVLFCWICVCVTLWNGRGRVGRCIMVFNGSSTRTTENNTSRMWRAGEMERINDWVTTAGVLGQLSWQPQSCGPQQSGSHPGHRLRASAGCRDDWDFFFFDKWKPGKLLGLSLMHNWQFFFFVSSSWLWCFAKMFDKRSDILCF